MLFWTCITENLDNKSFTLGVFIDLSKAFDTVDHTILLDKLYLYGIKRKTLKWLQCYLTGRKQFVVNLENGLLDIVCGVPQGSILGPLLFLIYVNDLCKASNKLTPIMFADDTNLFMSNKNIKQPFSDMNTELENVNIWLKANKLSLNVDKTKYMLFHNTNQSDNLPIKLPKLIMNSTVIEQVSYIKFLGILVD